MISPILPDHDATTIALDFGVFVAEQARAYRTSQSAILAAILPFLDREPILAPKPSESTSPKPSGSGPDNALDRVLITTPSQPEETSRAHAPAAETPASQAAGEATDGEAVTPRPWLSVAPETGLRELAEREAAKAHGGEGAAAPAAGESPAIPAAEDVGAQPAGGENVAAPEEPETETGIDAAVGGPAGATGSTVGAGAPKASRRRFDENAEARSLVQQCHEKNPTWPTRLIARAVGMHVNRVTGIAVQLKLSIPTQAEYDAAQKATRGAGLPRDPHSFEPKTAFERTVYALHCQRPTWTPSMVAKELGVNVDRVIPLLAKLRKQTLPPQVQAAPEFSGRSEMITHYSGVAKRLGKAK